MSRYLLIMMFLLSPPVLAQRQAFVVNNLAETLSLINLDDETVENHITILGETPNQVAFHDGFLYVVNSVSADIQKIDPSSHEIVADIYLPVGCNPYYLAFGGDYGYVTGWVSGRIYEIDLAANEVARESVIGGYPEGIIYDDGRVYVTQTYFNPDDFSYGQGRLAVIDIEDFTLEDQIEIGKNPQWISRAPDGRLHIVCTGNYSDVEGSIYVFDPAVSVVEDSILVGGQPAMLAVSPYGIGYLAAGGWVDYGHIYSYDMETGEIIRGPSNPITSGLGITWVAVDSLGFLYSCDLGDDTVTKLSQSGEVLRGFALGDGPISMVIMDDSIIGTEPDDDVKLPKRAGLTGNYPNPFNGATAIQYELPQGAASGARIEIFSILGSRIRSLPVETSGANGLVYWDGLNEAGQPCVSGVYFARLMQGEQYGGETVIKLSLVK
jgi:DNA-binding beta-propeller fold protein YncE